MPGFMDTVGRLVDGVMGAAGREARVESEVLSLSGAVERVTVNVDCGNVQVTGSADAKAARVTRRVHFHGEVRPRTEHRHESGELVLSGGTPGALKTGRIDHDIVVADGTDVTVEINAGDVRVSDISGTVAIRCDAGTIRVERCSGYSDVTCHAGNITLDRVSGESHLRSSSGSVRGVALAGGTVEVRSEAGAIRLQFDDPPDNVDASAGVGAVTIELPRGEYAVSTSTALGIARIEDVQVTPTSKHVVVARSDVGAVRIAGSSLPFDDEEDSPVTA